MQENYQKNLDLNPTLSTWKKKLIGWLIRKAELVPGIDLILLAEKCYQTEKPMKGPFLILENKYQGNIRSVRNIRLDPSSPIHFCITGTLSPAFGTWEGLTWFLNLLKAYPHFQLTIIGHCPIPAYQRQLHQVAAKYAQIHLVIANQPIPHHQIEEVLRHIEVAILPYQIQPAIREKMPTKLFECAALGIPVLMTPNPKWENFYHNFTGGFSVDFQQTDQALATFQQFLSQTYFSTPVPDSVLWKTEKLHFQEAIQNLLS